MHLRHFPLASMGATFALAALLGAPTVDQIAPLHRPVRRRRRPRGSHMRRRGWKFKGSPQAKRATRCGGNPAKARLPKP